MERRDGYEADPAADPEHAATLTRAFISLISVTMRLALVNNLLRIQISNLINT